MDPVQLARFGAGCVMTLAAAGSAAGAGVAGMAAIGAWKRCYMQNKPAPFILVGFVGAPLTQTIYGYIVMLSFLSAKCSPENALVMLAAGIFGGAAIGMSAYWQGRGAAAACDAFAETGKGVAGNFIVLGITETVALFVMVFLLTIKF